jgi:sortase (surface protein transpeptidase)
VARRKLREQEKRDQEKSKPQPRNLMTIAAIGFMMLAGFACVDSAIAAPETGRSYISVVGTPAVQKVASTAPETSPAPVVPVVAPVAPAPVVQAPAEAPVTPKIAVGEQYGSITVPRFNNGMRDLYEGTSNAIMDTLDSTGKLVTGRYKSTAPFGAPVITGVAGHSGVGDYSPFTNVKSLVPGDTAVIETSAGTYTYKYLWQEQVDPTDNKVLYNPVFRTPERKAGDAVEKALVLTTCGLLPNGDGDSSVRFIAYFELESSVAK